MAGTKQHAASVQRRTRARRDEHRDQDLILEFVSEALGGTKMSTPRARYIAEVLNERFDLDVDEALIRDVHQSIRQSRSDGTGAQILGMLKAPPRF